MTRDDMDDRTPLRVAVIGVGHLGRHHARILSSLEGVRLVAVADTNRDRAVTIAGTVGARPVFDSRELLGQVDAVSVAVPTESHLEVALPFLEQRVGVLIEKPLARTIEEADRLIEAAAASDATLAVGHTERFNPAVVAARPLVRSPRFIEVHRLGTFPERSLDIDVVFDLMIHDLDIVLSFVGSAVTTVDAVGVPVLTDRIDIANARLRFDNGCVANITASRISRDRIRKIRFFQPDAYVSIDYAAQELEMYRLNRAPGARPVIDGGKINIAHEEPLRRELADFASAVTTRRAPLVTGADGRAALALAARITERMSG
jgi:predicted dehydrogenase